ncbi:hypothetical protein GQX74_009496 [Glossina fuscipes]|nr:hypothetical protein GQX74_009496 [Glossina fuscipes]
MILEETLFKTVVDPVDKNYKKNILVAYARLFLYTYTLLLWLEWECADDGGVTAGIVAVGGVGNALKVGWQLSGGLSAPDLPAIVLVVAVEVVVGGPNDDGADESVAAVDLGT